MIKRGQPASSSTHSLDATQPVIHGRRDVRKLDGATVKESFCQHTGFDVNEMRGVDTFTKYIWNQRYPFDFMTHHFLLIVRIAEAADDDES